MTQEKRTIILTGATGTVGSWLMRHYLSEGSTHLLVVARDKGRHSAEMRIARALGLEGPEELPAGRIEILRWDLGRSGFGLEEREYLRMMTENLSVIHGAATTRLGDSEANCRRINLEGTHHVLEFCREAHRRGSLHRLSHISTAYVAGNQLETPLLEDALPPHPVFSNFYEMSKYLAEVSVRKDMAEGLPVTIFRPSIVVGDSISGRPSSFNVLYPFTRILVNGALSQVPVDVEGRMNLVPIDFVVNCIAAISAVSESIGRTYHLVSRIPQRIGMLLDLQKHFPELSHLFSRTRLVHPSEFDPCRLTEEEMGIYEAISAYLPYLSDHVDFDTANMEAILPRLSLQWPETGMPFLCKLFEYVVQVGYIHTA